ncbi:hypothetical protein [Ruegeria sp. HKCCA4812]|uniref:hypothetical protein n=1 Tax=Ruegeria sp. HKCCA4812 TaxID=2682993 RepID=UPI001487D655|nr:hypothetical protein [Ruegeria sp. HKCCA4812]
MNELRARLATLRDFRSVPNERPTEAVDSKADQEAAALASGQYGSIEKLRQKAETQTIVETNRDLKANRRLRWRYATWVFRYLVYYSIVVAGLIFLNAIGEFHFPYWFTEKNASDGSSSIELLWTSISFSIPESTLTTLVGSTAVSAIGLVLAVTHGLFGKK